MKKILVLLVTHLMVLTAFAQVGDATMNLESGTLDKAKASIDKAIENEKQKIKSNTWLVRAKIYKAIADDPSGLYKQKLDADTTAYIKAYEAYKKAIELEPESKAAKTAATDIKRMYFWTGYTKFLKQDYKGALELTKLAVEDPYAYDAKDTAKVSEFKNIQKNSYIIAAYSATNIGEYKTAARFYEKMIEKEIASEEVYTRLLGIYRNEKMNDESIALAKKALVKFPKSDDIAKESLNIYLSQNKVDEAFLLTEELSKKDPENATYNSILGVLYDKKGDKEKAQQYYEKTLEKDPYNYDINYNLGVLWFNKAAELNNKIAEDEKKLKPGQTDPRIPEANNLFRKALPYFEKANQIKTNEMEVLTNLSKIYKILKMKDKETAVNKQIENMN
jgi:tetratricopeptide (TPR) repeat protein